MLTRKRPATCSGGLIERARARPAVHTEMFLTGVTDSSNEKTTRRQPEGWGETEIHTETRPERRVTRLKSQTYFCSVSQKAREGWRMRGALFFLLNRGSRGG